MRHFFLHLLPVPNSYLYYSVPDPADGNRVRHYCLHLLPVPNSYFYYSVPDPADGNGVRHYCLHLLPAQRGRLQVRCLDTSFWSRAYKGWGRFSLPRLRIFWAMPPRIKEKNGEKGE